MRRTTKSMLTKRLDVVFSGGGGAEEGEVGTVGEEILTIVCKFFVMLLRLIHIIGL